MIKTDLVNSLVQVFPGIAKKDITAVIETLFESMALSLINGESVEIRGFGRLKVKKLPPMKGRNPRTAATVHVPTRWVIHFKPAVYLNDSIGRRIL